MAQGGDNHSGLTQVSNAITREFLEEAIRSKEGHSDIVVKQFAVQPGSLKADNFASLTFAVTAIAEERSVVKEHQLFVKALHTNKFLRGIAFKGKIFHKEGMFYSRILPDMLQHQIDRGVKPYGPSLPTYYYSIVDDETGLIVLQDMRALGYVLSDRLSVGLNYQHCKLVMEELATFHALSLVVKNKNPDNLKKYEHLFHDSMFGSPLAQQLPEALGGLIHLMKAACSRDNRAMGYIERLMKINPMETFRDSIKPVEPFSVICHGELWCNNLLFKYDEVEKKKPIEVKLLDLQAIRYALPTTDLAFFFFTSVARSTRKRYMHDLLRHYHSTFMDCLGKLNFDFPEFTFDILEGLFTKSYLYGVLSGGLLLPLSLVKPDEMPDLSTLSGGEISQTIDELFGRVARKEENAPIIDDRLIDTLADAVEMGIL